MIDRKALWIVALGFFAMMAAAFWRISLLPDWSHFPLNDPGDPQSRNSIWLFVGPLCLLLSTVLMFSRRWFASGSEENIQPWRRWSSMKLVPYTGIVLLMQAFILARSLGFGSKLDRLTFAHGIMVLIGLLIVVFGNAMPKMPWLSMRLRPFRLDPWQWNRHLRFMGRATVFLGLFVAIGGPLLPAQWFAPVFFSLWLAMMAASIAYRIKLRREQSPTV